MAASPEVRNLHNRVANARRWGKPDADDLAREFRAAKLEQQIREVVDGAPPLTDEQRQRLAAILAPGGAA